jgi:multidrug resistance efflux pump
MLKQVILILVVGTVLVAALVFSRWHHAPLKVSGFAEADEIRVGSRVGGRVKAVHVVEGQVVRPGDVLLELEPYDLLERRAQATADLAARTAEYARLTAGFRDEEIAQAQARRDQLAATLTKLKTGPRPQEIVAAEARVAQAQAQKELASLTQTRVKESFSRHAASAEEMDRANEEVKSAEQAIVVREQELALLKEGTRAEDIAAAEAQLREAEQALTLAKTGYRKEEVAAAKAAADAARAALAAVEQQVAELTIRAPVNGVVEALELQPGDIVAAGAPVLSLVDMGSLWVRAYVPENHLDVHIDQPVTVTVDSFPNRDFVGRISFVARQAEFTPGNVQTPEERSKQVFRIKVQLDAAAREVLRPGMAADVWLDKAPAARSTTQTTQPM